MSPIDVGGLKSALTVGLGITHPVMSAPMARVAGGALAAAVSNAGGLGMIGAGGATEEWLLRQFDIAGTARIGCGFVTWQLDRNPELLDAALTRAPLAVMFSYGDARPYAERVRDDGAHLVLQVSSLWEARQAVESGADVIVAQGTEAGGHVRDARSTMALVPEVRDMVDRQRSHANVLAAGGVGDGRGLAAALMLGADGVVVGTRFCLTPEALVESAVQDRVVRARGDDTIRTTVFDDLKGLAYPSGYSTRVLTSPFTASWSGTCGDLLRDPVLCVAGEHYRRGVGTSDPEVVEIAAGESVGLASRCEPAGTVVETMVVEAIAALDALPAVGR